MAVREACHLCDVVFWVVERGRVPPGPVCPERLEGVGAGRGEAPGVPQHLGILGHVPKAL